MNETHLEEAISLNKHRPGIYILARLDGDYTAELNRNCITTRHVMGSKYRTIVVEDFEKYMMYKLKNDTSKYYIRIEKEIR